MMTAARILQCTASISHASLNPALTLQRGLTAQIHRSFASSSGKDGEAVVKVDLEKQQIYASNLVNKTILIPADVRNSLTAGVGKQTTRIDAVSRPICLDMQATTPTVPCMLDTIVTDYTGLYGNFHSCGHANGWETAKAIDVALQQATKLIGAHPKEIITLQTEHVCTLDSCRHLQDEEIEKLGPKNGAFFCTHGAQSVGNIPVDVGKWNDNLSSVSGSKVYGPKDIGACNTHHKPTVRINPLTSGRGQERGRRSRTHVPSLGFALGDPSRISQEENEYTCTSNWLFLQTSMCPSTIQDNNYIHKHYHNKQPKQFTRTLWTRGYHKVDTENRKPKATTPGSQAGIRKPKLTEVPNTKADKNTDKKRRNLKCPTSYSEMTISEAEKRVGLSLALRGVSVNRMLEGKRTLLLPDVVLKLKTKIYQDLVNYLEVGGYPTDADADFKEGNIINIVLLTICPIIGQFKHATKQKLRLTREKEITSIDSGTGGTKEFVVMDKISYDQKNYVFVVETQKASLREGIKECFLSLKDMRDCNGGGTVYGFLTQGDSWRMASYDGTFMLSKKIGLLFDDMDENQEEWIADYSILVECINVALSNAGKEPVKVV